MNRFSLPVFTPEIDLANDKTHLWTRGIVPEAIIVPYMQIETRKAQRRLLSLIDEYSLNIIVRLPTDYDYPLSLIPKEELKILAHLPLTAVMMGFHLDYQDYPRTVTNEAVARALNQLDLLVEILDMFDSSDCAIIPSLPGAHLDQILWALYFFSEYQQTNNIHFPFLALRGGLYTLIKLHSKVNTYLNQVHKANFTPLLYWDGWWIPSRFLNVKHFFGASWWQFGLHRFKFVRRRHYGYRYCSSTHIARITDIIDHNYQYLIARIKERGGN